MREKERGRGLVVKRGREGERDREREASKQSRCVLEHNVEKKKYGRKKERIPL